MTNQATPRRNFLKKCSLAINESLMTQSVQDIFAAWKKGIEIAQK